MTEHIYRLAHVVGTSPDNVPAPRWAIARVASTTEQAKAHGERLTAYTIARRTGLSTGLVKRCLATLAGTTLSLRSADREITETGASS